MGKMGKIRLTHLNTHSEFDVTFVCDSDKKNLDAFPEIQKTTDPDEVINSNVDVIFIATPNIHIPDLVCKALAAGHHVFCEKPPGCSVADVEKIIKAENENPDCVLKFGFNHRFHYGVMEAKSIIDSGRYGNILWARGVYGKAGGVNFEDNWRNKKDLSGGGILLDQGIHMLDLLLYFLGPFERVKSMVQNCFWKKSEVEDNAFALMETYGNKIAMLHSTATQWRHKFSLDLFLEDGYVCLNGILSSTRSYGEESITFARKQFEGQSRAFGKPREETIFFDQDDSWKLEIEEFYQCLMNRDRKPIGSSNDALAVMQLIERIYEVSSN